MHIKLHVKVVKGEWNGLDETVANGWICNLQNTNECLCQLDVWRQYWHNLTWQVVSQLYERLISGGSVEHTPNNPTRVLLENVNSPFRNATARQAKIQIKQTHYKFIRIPSKTQALQPQASNATLQWLFCRMHNFRVKQIISHYWRTFVDLNEMECIRASF